MAETYLQLAQKIEELQQRAATIKGQETTEVVERIKIAIKAYGLTVEQLFGATRSPSASDNSAAKKTSKKSSGAKFADDAGNVWSGRGPRPRWIKAALAAGQSMDKFAVAPGDAAVKPAGQRGAKPARAAKYKDEDGNSWSGRGPKPRWFKAALEAGKTIDQLAA